MQNSKIEAILENTASVKIKYLIFHGMRTVDTEIYALINLCPQIGELQNKEGKNRTAKRNRQIHSFS